MSRNLTSTASTLARIGGFSLVAFAASQAAWAQAVPRSFVASPEIYKVVSENPEFRVIEVTWKPGQKDAVHSHPASGVYYLSDCSLRLHAPDGTTRDVQPRAGAAFTQAPITSHWVENIGSADCRLVMFEPR